MMPSTAHKCEDKVDVGVELEGLVYGDLTVCDRSVSLRLLVLA